MELVPLDACWGTADLHLHSSESDGTASPARLLEYVERHTTLDVIALTDHDDLRPSLKARELAVQRGYRFQVVTGMEVTTRAGHLIALFLETPVPILQSLERTVAFVHEHGGLCVVPHPFSRFVSSVRAGAFARMFSQPDPAGHVDGIELSRAHFAAARVEPRARALAQRHGLAEIGSSDAHFLPAVGTSHTSFPGRTADDLRQAILERAAVAHSGRAVKLRELPARDLLRQQVRGTFVLPLRRARVRLGRLRPGRLEAPPPMPLAIPE